jgi:dienelactone hydrolase
MVGRVAIQVAGIITVLMMMAQAAAADTLWLNNMWLDRAVADRPPAGPPNARGAVIWSHGLSLYDEDSQAPSPPYLRSLAGAGWDVFRFNRRRTADNLDATTAGLVQAARDLRRQGYRRVVLAGQSFGAFTSLKAVAEDGVAEAVIATAPAAYGSFFDSFPNWRANAHELYALLSRVGRARIMLFLFHGDDYDPGGRGDTARALLARRPGFDLVIDQPADLSGHAAAATGLFARRFAACIDRFAACIDRFAAGETTRSAADCEKPWGRQPSADLPAAPMAAKLASTAGGAAGTWLGSWYGFYRNGRELLVRIDRIVGDAVTATYMLGAGVGKDERAETAIRRGRLVAGELVFDEPGLNVLRYRLRPDGTLAGTWQAVNGGAALDTVLRRLR